MRSFLLLLAITACASAEPSIGPEKGSLFIHGGGRLTKDQVKEFIALAGGPEGPFVIIPGAAEGEDWGEEYVSHNFLVRAGAKAVSVLHTRDRNVADTAEFNAPLTKARGVWIDGGRQWRLADSYLGTRTVKELHAVLERGGAIGGSSAGATIQGSYLVRGAPEGNHIMMAKGHEEGFAFLKQSAIDQHTITRKRENDLAAVIDAHPRLLGLGIDESTALIVQGNRARVFGDSKVVVHDKSYQPGPDGLRYFLISPGETLDLTTRRIIK